LIVVIYDLVIIGAGPSGTAAAISALRSVPDLKVLLVDKEFFPRDKPCGDGLGPGVVSVLEAIEAADVLDGEVEIDSCTVYGPDGSGFSSELPTIDGRRLSGYVVPRLEFDHRLVGRAVSVGAELLEGWSFDSLSDSSPDPVSVSLKKGNEKKIVHARAVIAADGANSRVRSFLKVARNSPRLTGIAIRAYANSRRESKANSLIFEWSDELLPAYAWYFPTSSEVVNVGLGLVVRDSQRRRFQLRENLERFVRLLKNRNLPLTDLRNERSYLLPHGARLPRLAHGRVMLIGDAGSMINPLSGEGIFYGMFAGVEVGRAFACLAPKHRVEDAFAAAEKSFRKRFTWHYRSNYIASVMLRSRRWASLVIRAAGRDPKVLASGVELLFGEGRLSISTSFRIVWRHVPW